MEIVNWDIARLRELFMFWFGGGMSGLDMNFMFLWKQFYAISADVYIDFSS